MIKNKLFYLFIIIISLTGCIGAYLNDKLKIQNNWDKPIAVLYSTDSSVFKHSNYDYYTSVAVNPDSIRPIYIYAYWEEIIDFSVSKKLYIMFYDVDTLNKYKDMDYVIKNQLHLYKRGYSKQELIDRNWIVNFFH